MSRHVKRENSKSADKLRDMDQEVTDSIKRLALSQDGRPADGRLHIAPPVTISQPILTVMSNAKDDFESRYNIVKEIGKGAFSTVYLCQSKVTHNKYAVKMVDLRPLRLNERFNPARLKREVEIMRRLKHPNVIGFHEVYEDTDTLMMIMEYCPGVELFDEILNRKFFTEADAKLVFFQVANALFYLHSMNIIHRDIKPENILFVQEPVGDLTSLGLGPHFRGPVAKLLDFGLSKNAGKDGSAGKTFVGTPCYLAPEVEYTAKGKGGTYGLPADCWSLGAVLYVMLVARFPEFEQEQYTGKIVVKLRPELWGHVTEEAKDLIRKLMNTNPSARLTMSGALQHPWLGAMAVSRDELARRAAATYNMGHALQEEEVELLEIDSRYNKSLEKGSLTAGGNTVAEQRMVVVRRSGMGTNLGAGGGAVANTMNSEMLHLTPLLHLQRSIATCFEEAHSAYQHFPDIATHVRRGAMLCRQQLAASTKMLREVEQTASAVLGMFPDLELAVEEGEPIMAANFFTMVRTWVTDLRKLVSSTQAANRASMEQIQLIVEQSTIGLHQQQLAAAEKTAASYVVPKRIFDALLHTAGTSQGKLQIGNGASREQINTASAAAKVISSASGNSDTVALTAEQVLDLFVTLFPSQSHIQSSSESSSSASAADASSRKGMPTIEEQRVFSLDSDGRNSSVEGLTDAADAAAAAAAASAADISSRDPGELDSGVMTEDVEDSSVIKTTPSKYSEDGRKANRSSPLYDVPKLSPSTRQRLQITAQVAVEDVDGEEDDGYGSGTGSANSGKSGPEPSPKAANKLAEALSKLREVDAILEQLSLFWANTEVVLDTLTKKGQHVEQFVGFSSKPRLMARFLERIEEYKRFWEGIAVMCSTYINGVQHQQQHQQDSEESDPGPMYSFLDNVGGSSGPAAGTSDNAGPDMGSAQVYMQNSWNYTHGVPPAGPMYSPGVVESLSTASPGTAQAVPSGAPQTPGWSPRATGTSPSSFASSGASSGSSATGGVSGAPPYNGKGRPSGWGVPGMATSSPFVPPQPPSGAAFH